MTWEPRGIHCYRGQLGTRDPLHKLLSTLYPTSTFRLCVSLWLRLFCNGPHSRVLKNSSTVESAVAFPTGIILVFPAEATFVVAFGVERRFRSSVGGAMTLFNKFAVVNRHGGDP